MRPALYSEETRAVLAQLVRDLLALAEDCRRSAGPLGVALNVARTARADAYEVVAARLRADLQD